MYSLCKSWHVFADFNCSSKVCQNLQNTWGLVNEKLPPWGWYYVINQPTKHIHCNNHITSNYTMSKLWVHKGAPYSESKNFKRPAIGKVFLSTDALWQRYHCWKWQPVWLYKLCNYSIIYWAHSLGSLITTHYGHNHLLLFVVSIVTMLWAGWSGVQLPAGIRDFSLPKHPDLRLFNE